MAASKDLVGKRFGRLTVLKKTERRIQNHVVWLCKCDCGNFTEVTSDKLTGFHTKSCGCARIGVNLLDITGRRFGRLVALHPTEKRLGNSVIWRCKCDCGKTADVASMNLMNGNTRSCGCISSEASKRNSAIMRSHRSEDYVEGTDVRKLMQSPSAANTSGIVGVSYDRSVHLWKATIQFKGKRYYLGSSVDIQVAIDIRREAEQRIHGDFLEWYYAEHPERRPDAMAKRKEGRKNDR